MSHPLGRCFYIDPLWMMIYIYNRYMHICIVMELAPQLATAAPKLKMVVVTADHEPAGSSLR